MTIEISYFRSNGTIPDVMRDPLTSESITISASPALSGAAPVGARLLSMAATEAGRFEYGVSPTATSTSHYIAAGERLWMEATPRSVLSLRTP